MVPVSVPCLNIITSNHSIILSLVKHAMTCTSLFTQKLKNLMITCTYGGDATKTTNHYLISHGYVIPLLQNDPQCHIIPLPLPGCPPEPLVFFLLYYLPLNPFQPPLGSLTPYISHIIMAMDSTRNNAPPC